MYPLDRRRRGLWDSSRWPVEVSEVFGQGLVDRHCRTTTTAEFELVEGALVVE